MRIHRTLQPHNLTTNEHNGLTCTNTIVSVSVIPAYHTCTVHRCYIVIHRIIEI